MWGCMYVENEWVWRCIVRKISLLGFWLKYGARVPGVQDPIYS
jgi:hypothetical protein